MVLFRFVYLLIAAIALAFLHLCLRMLTYVLSERTTDVVAFFELTLIVATNVSLIASGVDQLTFVFSFFIWHCAPPLMTVELQ